MSKKSLVFRSVRMKARKSPWLSLGVLSMIVYRPAGGLPITLRGPSAADSGEWVRRRRGRARAANGEAPAAVGGVAVRRPVRRPGHAHLGPSTLVAPERDEVV